MDFMDSDLLKMNFDQPTPKIGDLLLAEPLMTDIAFSRSVVILVEHNNETGSLGFVTNKRSKYTLNELVAEIDIEEEIPVYVGGPVHHDRLFYIHTLGNIIPESIDLGNGLYVSGDFNVIIEYVNSGAPINGKIRFILGYSGWDSKQLEGELQNFDWAVIPNNDSAQILTLDSENAWRTQVSKLDSKYKLWLNCPKNASLN